MSDSSAKIMIAAVSAAALAFQAVAADAPAAQPAKAPAPAASAAQPAAPAKPVTLEEVFAFLPDVLAEVGSQKITKAYLIKQLSHGQIAPEMLAQLPKNVILSLVAQQINDMIDQAVCLELAKRDGIMPSEEYVKKEMDKIYNTLPQAQKDELDKNLKAQGTTFAKYRDDAAKNPDAQKYWACSSYLRGTVIDKAKSSVTDADAEKFYRENQKRFEKPAITVSHILALVPQTDDAGQPLSAEVKAQKTKEAKAKIDGIYAKLKQGAKFEDLAEKESDCPSGKQAKGKLPAFTKEGRMANGQGMDPTFTAAAAKLDKPGQISEIVETPFGYHIIRLEEKKNQEYVPFADVKEQIKSQLVSEKLDKDIRALLDQGKKDLNVKIFLPKPEAAEAAPAK